MANSGQQLPSLSPQQVAIDARSSILACNATAAALATVAVGVRFWARWTHSTGYGADDYLIAVAPALGWGLVASLNVAMGHIVEEGGQGLTEANGASIMTEAQALLASQVLFAVLMAAVKVSTLLLYLRSFGQRRSLLVAGWGLGMFTITWAAVVLVVSLLQCQPLAAFWDESVHGTCINVTTFSLSTGVLNTMTDVVLVVLPMPALSCLQLTKLARICLGGVLLVGASACVFSGLRLASFIPSSSTSSAWLEGTLTLWTVFEPSMAIVAVCLPTCSILLFRPVNEPPATPVLPFILPDTRSESAASSRKTRRSFDWSNIELVKPSKWTRESEPEEPREGVIEIRTTFETRHSYRKMSGSD